MPFVQPSRKRARFDSDDDSDEASGDALYSFYSNGVGGPIAQRKMFSLPSKRARIPSQPHKIQPAATTTLSEQEQEQRSRPPPPPRHQSCHVCNRHPTRKSHLDSFAYCGSCDLWTCYVCIRRCAGWSAGGDAHLPTTSDSLPDADADDSVTMTEQGEPDSPVDASAEESSRPQESPFPHASAVCRKCAVELRQLGGEVACIGCHLAIESGF